MSLLNGKLALDRRALVRAGLAGAGVAWLGSAAWSTAHAASRPRLAVLMMQGGMDGLSVAPPLNDERYRVLRGGLAIAEPLPFTTDFGLHPALPELARMAKAGEVRIAPAAASPSCSRSHSAEADLLTCGGVDLRGPTDGWLNRAVAAFAPGRDFSAVSLDAVASVAVTGPAVFGSWAPGAPQLNLRLVDHLQSLYQGDAVLRELLNTTTRVQRRAAAAAEGPPTHDLATRARALGRLFRDDDGPVAGFLSSGGFDTHQDQGSTHGRLADRLREMDQALAALREGAADAWSKTVVVVFTEFGRTAATNGVGGTDHGVASTAFVLGGAVKAGGLIGDWPTLVERSLYEGRDVASGLDLRSLFKGVLAEHWGLGRRQLDELVFPGSATVPGAKGLVA